MHDTVLLGQLGVPIGLLAFAFVLLVIVLIVARRTRDAVARFELDEAEVKRRPDACDHCRYFDLEAGQAALGAQEIFSQVMRHVPPADMTRKVVEDADGNVHIERTGPTSMQWKDIGECSFHDEGRWRFDVCDHFKAGEFVQVRSKRARA